VSAAGARQHAHHIEPVGQKPDAARGKALAQHPLVDVFGDGGLVRDRAVDVTDLQCEADQGLTVDAGYDIVR